jgi:hypothetical protein
MYYTTRLLVFLAVTGGLAAAIVLLLSGELIAPFLHSTTIGREAAYAR